MILIIVKGTIFLFISGPGILGNLFVLVNHMCAFFWDTEKKSIHLIIIHLAFSNLIMLFSKGTIKTITTFGLINVLDDVGCKTIVYLERVARGLSICTTSLLTVVQAIIISPRVSMRVRLNLRSTWHILSLFLFFWILNSLISMNLLYYIKNINTINRSQINRHDIYCFYLPRSQIIKWVLLIPMALRDALFQCIMGWTSVYVILLLHNHHKHVLYIQNSKIFCQTPPEIRAAQSVLLLMLSFLFFYWLDCIISLYFLSSSDIKSITLNILETVTLGFALLSPFVQIHRDGHMVKCWHVQ